MNGPNNEGKAGAGGAWSCKHCKAINVSRQQICGCAASRKEAGRVFCTLTVDDIQLPHMGPSNRLEW